WGGPAPTVLPGEPTAPSVPPLRPASSVAVPLRSVQATTLVCASATFGSWSRTPTGAVADRMCFDGSLKVGASETGVMICTDGSVDAQDTPWMVVVVG